MRSFVEDTNRDLLDILGEKYLTDNTPTMILNKCIGNMEVALSDLQKLFASSSRNRNAVVEEAAQLLADHAAQIQKAASDLRNAEIEDMNEAVKEEQLIVFRISQNGAFGPLPGGGVAGVTEKRGGRIVVRVEQNERNERILEPFFGKPEWLFLDVEGKFANYHPGAVVRSDRAKGKIVLEFLADQKISKDQAMDLAKQQRKA